MVGVLGDGALLKCPGAGSEAQPISATYLQETTAEYFNAHYDHLPRFFWQFGYAQQAQSLDASRKGGTLFQVGGTHAINVEGTWLGRSHCHACMLSIVMQQGTCGLLRSSFTALPIITIAAALCVHACGNSCSHVIDCRQWVDRHSDMCIFTLCVHVVLSMVLLLTLCMLGACVVVSWRLQRPGSTSAQRWCAHQRSSSCLRGLPHKLEHMVRSNTRRAF